jgi:hypothetical protein
MLSRINDLIKHTHSKSDAIERPGPQGRDKEGKRKEEAPAEEKNDGMFFSIEAIRALLKQENALSPDLAAALDLLLQNGIANIPIRDEQPIPDAIKTAAARFK